MAYTTTTRLGLKKAVVGSNQAFETAEINSNWDKVDAEAVATDTRLDTAEGQIVTANANIGNLQTLTTSGTVNAATTAVTASNALKIGGRLLTVSSTTPSSPTSGDLWIQI